MNTNEISYALAKQVPDMARGFTIQTSYGELVIEPGQMAERIATTVRLVLEVETLCVAPGATPGMDKYDFPGGAFICCDKCPGATA